MGGNEPPSENITFSYHSENSLRDNCGQYTFLSIGAGAHKKPVKISLASMEFPMSQYSIEEDWQRLYFMERVYITDNTREISFGYRSLMPQEHWVQGTVMLPLAANRITRITYNQLNARLFFTTEHPHGLFAGNRSLVTQWQAWYEKCAVYGAPFGAVDLSESDMNGDLQAGNTPYTFSIRWAPPGPITAPVNGWLICPSPPTFAHLASVVTAGLHELIGRESQLTYDPVENKMEFSLRNWPTPEATELAMYVCGDDLAARMGFTQATREKIVRRRGLHLSSAFPCIVEDSSQRQLLEATMSLDTVKNDQTTLQGCSVFWPHVCIPPGWYGPSKRSYAPTQPQRLSSELEMQFNRLVIKPREDGGPKLVIVNTEGQMLVIPILVGKFTGETMALMFTQSMSDQPGNLTCTYVGQRFVFQGDRTFSLVFNHPLSIDANRLGFERLLFEGMSEYQGEKCVIADFGWGGVARTSSNLYGVTDDGARPKLRFVGMAPPPYIAVVVSVSPGAPTLETFISGQPAAHGLRPGDTVRLCRPSGPVELSGSDVPTFDPAGTFAVVNEVPTLNTIVVSTPVFGPWVGAVNMACTLRTPIEPVSWCFSPSLPYTIGGRRVGMPRRALQHIIDGQYQFLAPYVLDIEHPDYVLFYIQSGKRSTSNIHIGDDTVTQPLAKIVLYPGFREERSLTRDMIMASGEDISRFVVEFRNPDGTQYHMHGAAFSFSLNLLMLSQG